MKSPHEKALGNVLKGKNIEGVSTRKSRAIMMEKRSKKAGFYVHGHKNLGDVYEA